MLHKIVLCLLLCISSNACAQNTCGSLWNKIQSTLGALAYAAKNALGLAPADNDDSTNFEVPATVTLSDIEGFEKAKKRFGPSLAYAQDPVKYASIGAAIIPNYILHDPSYTKALTFAQAIAGEMQKLNPEIRILEIPISLCCEIGVDATMDLLRTYTPCVAIIQDAPLSQFQKSLDRREIRGDLIKALGYGQVCPSPDKPVFLLLVTESKNVITPTCNILNTLGNFCIGIALGA